MSKKAYSFIKKVLGEDFLETLEKTELYKPKTNTTVDPEEMHAAMAIVPKAMISFLAKELVPMQIGEAKEIQLHVGKDAILHAKKIEKDCYNGEIIEDNKKVAEFYSRTLPGVGLYILTTFELYDMSYTEDKSTENKEELDNKISKMIEERLLLRELIEQVVDKKLMEKDAIEKLLAHKLSDLLQSEKMKKEINTEITITKDEGVGSSSIGPGAIETGDSQSAQSDSADSLHIINIKGSPIVDFLNRKKKKKKIDFYVEMAKNEKVNCPDCRKEIFNSSGFSGCLCLGDDMNSKIIITKSEEGVKLSFGKNWDYENIEMLLEVLRRKNA